MKKFLLAVLLSAAATASFAQNSYREFSLGSATVIATGSQAAVDTLPVSIRYVTDGARLTVDVTAVSGTSPSATFSLEGQVGSQWYQLCALSAITAVNKGTCTATNVPAVVRLAYTISGTTPSFTFTADAVKH